MTTTGAQPNWRLLLDAAEVLTEEHKVPFSRADLIGRVLERHPERNRSSLNVTIQGMTRGVPGAVPVSCGHVFERVERGFYELLDPASSVPEAAVEEPLSPEPASSDTTDTGPSLSTAVETYQRFIASEGGLAERIRTIEAALPSLDMVDATAKARTMGATGEILSAARLVKDLAGEVNVVIHAMGILVSLPYILGPAERIESLSLGAGNTGKEWDLETDRQIAEFKFIDWRGGAESIRQNTALVDLYHLAMAETGKRRVLYVTGDEFLLTFLHGRRAIRSVLTKHASLRDEFHDRHGEKYPVVRDWWNDYGDKLEIVDLRLVVPGLAALHLDDS